jgi:hypothetical protein
MVIDSYRKKKTIPQCRNLAINNSATRYLAFIDDDCVLGTDWIINAYNTIRQSPKVAFVVGKSKLLNPKSSVAKVQYDNYLHWFNQTHSLDTKNLILDLHQIKNIRFDTQFKIFEDVDFSLQLQEHHLIGKYEPKMIIHHPEVSSLLGAIRKNFIRGQYKANITRKWGEYDNYSHAIPKFSNPIDFILKVAFLLGYLKKRPRPITIVNHSDNGANSKRLNSVNNFLTSHHLFVKTLDSHTEFQKVIAGRRYLLTYGFSLLKYRFLKRICEYRHQDIGPALLVETMELKSQIIDHILRSNHSSLVIVQNPEDMLVATISPRPYKVLYDSPTLFYRELELNSDYTPKTVKTIKSMESKVYLQSDFTAFHWYTYFKIAKNYGLKVRHPLLLNWGCEDTIDHAKFNKKAKIVHLGKLNSYWVNPQLLTSIASKTNLDIFSYEKPQSNFYPKLSRFKGYLPKESDISKYQFGLITLSKDDLRSSGFSAKYLLYLSYGLPVLCPDWRYDPLLSSATIYYNETNIKEILEKYRDPVLWQKKHLAALKLSNKLSWKKTLKNLLTIINE